MITMLPYVLMTVRKLKRKILPRTVPKREGSSNVASGYYIIF
jgi:hypothetical protein